MYPTKYVSLLLKRHTRGWEVSKERSFFTLQFWKLEMKLVLHQFLWGPHGNWHHGGSRWETDTVVKKNPELRAGHTRAFLTAFSPNQSEPNKNCIAIWEQCPRWPDHLPVSSASKASPPLPSATTPLETHGDMNGAGPSIVALIVSVLGGQFPREFWGHTACLLPPPKSTAFPVPYPAPPLQGGASDSGRQHIFVSIYWETGKKVKVGGGISLTFEG